MSYAIEWERRMRTPNAQPNTCMKQCIQLCIMKTESASHVCAFSNSIFYIKNWRKHLEIQQKWCYEFCSTSWWVNSKCPHFFHKLWGLLEWQARPAGRPRAPCTWLWKARTRRQNFKPQKPWIFQNLKMAISHNCHKKIPYRTIYQNTFFSWMTYRTLRSSWWKCRPSNEEASWEDRHYRLTGEEGATSILVFEAMQHGCDKAYNIRPRKRGLPCDY